MLWSGMLRSQGGIPEANDVESADGFRCWQAEDLIIREIFPGKEPL